MYLICCYNHNFINLCAGAICFKNSLMEIYDKKSFFEFLATYAEHSKTRIYRGVYSDKFKLIPSIGRHKNVEGTKSLDLKDEDSIFTHFKQRANRFLKQNYDDINLLAIAQHHGLPTRLLDWTFNPLAAVFFAVEHEIIQPQEESQRIECSVVYVFDKNFNNVIREFESFKVTKLDYFIPNFHDERIISQSGIFTVHPHPWNEEFVHEDIRKIKIELKFRRELRKILNRLGVNKATLFPDLDGISKQIKWMRTDDF